MRSTGRGLSLSIIAALVVLPGCTMSAPPAPGCVPRIFVQPRVAAPGDAITLTSDTACDDPVPDEGWVLFVSHAGDDARLATTASDAAFDGSFEATLTLPDDFPAGDAYAGIENWDYSFCSGSGSCASATGDFTVRP